MARSTKYVANVDSARSVVNLGNVRVGIKERRGDGAFGEIVPNIKPVPGLGYVVKRAPIATLEIGIEVKIFSKAMNKQMDRVEGDLEKQARLFKSRGSDAIRVAIVGVNRAAYTVGYEGDREFPTTGKAGFLHPIQEAEATEKHVRAVIEPLYDEVLFLRYKATNDAPYPFAWEDKKDTEMRYGALLARVSQQYQKRF
ncbi:MAG: hypothetical protein Q8R82_07780 [Hyphomonadaceae bacterium]|nr:hypothetical protein [Hyphomonadaceae bacterium]